MSRDDQLEQLARDVVDCGFQLHRDIGPGLLESVYEVLLFRLLEQRGLRVARQVPIAISYQGVVIDNAFKADLLVEDRLLIELGIPHELHQLDFEQGQQKSAQYLALNPAGRVPTLVIDGQVLTDSAAIAMHLADLHPQARLAPALQSTVKFRLIEIITTYNCFN